VLHAKTLSLEAAIACHVALSVGLEPPSVVFLGTLPAHHPAIPSTFVVSISNSSVINITGIRDGLDEHYFIEVRAMEASVILRRLIEIGEALGAKGQILYAHDIHRIREMVLDAQDLLLRMEKDSLQSSDR